VDSTRFHVQCEAQEVTRLLRIESFDTGQLAELSFLPPNTPMRSRLEGAANANS
jgi:hypothetical protein